MDNEKIDWQEAAEAREAEPTPVQTLVLEGYAHMDRDEWNVPSTVWIADRPAAFSIEGVWLHHALDGVIASHKPFSDDRHTRVRITVEVLEKDVPHDTAHDQAHFDRLKADRG